MRPEYNLFPFAHYYGLTFSVIFNIFSTPLFAFVLCLMLIGGITGSEKFIQGILGGHYWTLLSRLTFQVYLIHLPIYYWYFAQTRVLFYGNHMFFVWNCISLITISFILAFPVTIIFESPFIQISKLLLMPQKPNEKLLNHYESDDFEKKKLIEDPTSEE